MAAETRRHTARWLAVLLLGAGCASGGSGDGTGPSSSTAEGGGDDAASNDSPTGNGYTDDSATPETGGGGDTGCVNCNCPVGQTLCGGSCVNTASDPANCGQCNLACSGGSACTNGKCGGTCGASQTMCGSTCVDTGTDKSNCGTCGHACSASEPCCAGSCANTSTDPFNCGTCGHSCSGQPCTSGACGVSCSLAQAACAHSLCTTGAPLGDGCDPNGCTFSLCDPFSFLYGDPSCCSVAWDATCVAEAQSYFAQGECGL